MTAIFRGNRLSRSVFLNSVIRSVIDTMLIGGIYFFLSSMARNPTSIGIFLALYSLVAIVSVTVEVIFDSVMQTVNKYDRENKSHLGNNILIYPIDFKLQCGGK
ncbi:DUF6347 domain-containing protein [Photorhabdus asymbiotica]|uniref:DUF6347 domain-containing protein n=1 Tax=Photorhabdus asymbiotica TaxID=291112 RepID=UPI003DA732BC